MQLSVLQWNVWFKQNIEHVVDVLKTYNADVICLQELTNGYTGQNHTNTWEYVAQELGYHYRVQEIPIITAEAQWLQANAIFSRLPIQSHEARWVHEPHNSEDTSDQYRGYLEVTLDVRGNACTVATTHMSFSNDPADDKELRRLLSIIDVKRAPYILTGDLNATPESQRVIEITKRLQHAGPAYDQNTWTTKPFTYGDINISTLDWRFDYIFTSPGLVVSEAAILQTDISDHLPVKAVITIS